MLQREAILADRLVVACVQQRMHLPQSLDEYRDDLRRFLRVAVGKQARLVVFPELGGTMTAPPVLRDFRAQLLKQMDRGQRRQANLWQRMMGGVAGSLATFLRADLRLSLAALLDVASQELWENYQGVYSGLAREFGVTVVAPSAYLPDPTDGVIRNVAAVFDSNGQLAGCQAKVVLHPEDVDLAQAGSSWDVIQTEVGRIGLILGSDVLYPEVGRLLAYQGADLFVVQAACTDVALYQKIRAGTLARMQDNQLFAVASFLVGNNLLSRRQRLPFIGKSAIFAPQELTPRANGVLVEMGNVRSEGVLAAPWDFVALKRLWDTSDTPVRRQLPLQQAGTVLAQLYARLQTLPRTLESQTNAPAKLGRAAAIPSLPAHTQTLDDLVVIGSITSRWPLHSPYPSHFLTDDELDDRDDDDLFLVVTEDALENVIAMEQAESLSPATHLMPAPELHSLESDPEADPETDDETDEMDIVTTTSKDC